MDDLWMIYEGFMGDLRGFMEGLMMQDLWRIYGGFIEDL